MIRHSPLRAPQQQNSSRENRNFSSEQNKPYNFLQINAASLTGWEYLSTDKLFEILHVFSGKFHEISAENRLISVTHTPNLTSKMKKWVTNQQQKKLPRKLCRKAAGLSGPYNINTGGAPCPDKDKGHTMFSLRFECATPWTCTGRRGGNLNARLFYTMARDGGRLTDMLIPPTQDCCQVLDLAGMEGFVGLGGTSTKNLSRKQRLRYLMSLFQTFWGNNFYLNEWIPMLLNKYYKGGFFDSVIDLNLCNMTRELRPYLRLAF